MLDTEFQWKTNTITISSLCTDFGKLMALGNFIDPKETDGIILALEEAFTNSIDHGNLELKSELKPQSYDDADKYEKLKTDRLNDPQYGGRYIICRIKVSSTEIIIEIEDQGKGFNPDIVLSKINEKYPSRKEILSSSGKGILLIRKYFEDIQYIKNGTCIRLIKKRNS